MRRMAARDSRGRFVACPTTDAPSWYVFCADGYRILGEAPAGPLPATVPVAPRELPRAIVRAGRPWFTRSDVQSYLLILLVIIVSAWYGFHLTPSHR